MRIVGLIFAVVVIGFLIGFMILNSQTKVDVDLFGHRIFDISLSMVCLYAFVAGMVFVLIFALADEIVLRTYLYRANKENKELKQELSALRNLPFEEEK
ncbi:hypothetical protein AMJ52_02720 [candidate division TA06 bacterium DG_78]|uniref:Lipopolysaccharide assembly protein A domain-containing protein n=1 Tax=candidate division TA06 bacterium DG_78 TaxID=1703772 RepID=A0A0S7YI29_UNCT6|nr:MAG: hypothetical protein AMJ52_02720 [candidate division TA06 bacterium DG_78]